MKSDVIKEKKEKIVEKYGGWTAHNIDLGDGIYTINETLNYDTLKLRRVIQIICDISDEKIGSLKILDLGSLEGLYTIELGLQGANVVAIEGRQANLKKAGFAKDALKIDNIQFFQDDVKDLSEGKYGRFDVILCLGLLYHLDIPAVFHLLENMYKMCDGFLIIDTNIAQNSDSKADYRGLSYFGTYTREFRKGLSKNEKIKHV
ncbi:MAG: methyltransferase domain-containing protein, partial [Candidatus Omnitrophica bacterium]|nr:methyltransferase domain-containing protein [Candidatus Omnitrophota bacterium]